MTQFHDGTDLLAGYVDRTHDGVIIELDRYSSASAQRVGALGAVAYLAVGPLTLLLLALPGAAFIEWGGWWLVNERVLFYRWMGYGTLVWAGLVALAWLTWLAPPRQRIEITPRTLSVVQRRLGWVITRTRIPMEQVYQAEGDQHLTHNRVLVRHAGGTLRIAVPDPELPHWGLALLISELAEEARTQKAHGTPHEVPAPLRRLLERDR